jgi:hypothetical protein
MEKIEYPIFIFLEWCGAAIPIEVNPPHSFQLSSLPSSVVPSSVLPSKMSNLPPPPPLRRVCNLPTCDENCVYCRENDRLAAARRGLPFLAPDVGAGGAVAEPSPTNIPRLAFGAPAEPAAEGLALLAEAAAAAEPAAEGLALLANAAAAVEAAADAEPAAEPAVVDHPGVAAAQAAVAAGTIAPASSQWWAHVLGTTNPPTLEEYEAMERPYQGAWNCIICGGPALEGSPQPGRVCSYECMYDKYR